MKLVIYGRKSCPFCVKAKKLAEDLKSVREDFDFDYIDYEEKGMSKEDISNEINQTVNTVPQILLDEKYIGGYDDLSAYVRKNRLFSKH